MQVKPLSLILWTGANSSEVCLRLNTSFREVNQTFTFRDSRFTNPYYSIFSYSEATESVGFKASVLQFLGATFLMLRTTQRNCIEDAKWLQATKNELFRSLVPIEIK